MEEAARMKKFRPYTHCRVRSGNIPRCGLSFNLHTSRRGSHSFVRSCVIRSRASRLPACTYPVPLFYILTSLLNLLNASFLNTPTNTFISARERFPCHPADQFNLRIWIREIDYRTVDCIELLAALSSADGFAHCSRRGIL
jgi:hypothetical protein